MVIYGVGKTEYTKYKQKQLIKTIKQQKFHLNT